MVRVTRIANSLEYVAWIGKWFILELTNYGEDHYKCTFYRCHVVGERVSYLIYLMELQLGTR